MFRLYSSITLGAFIVSFLMIHFFWHPKEELETLETPARLGMEVIEAIAVSMVISFIFCLYHWHYLK